jgi:hypothetical protein
LFVVSCHLLFLLFVVPAICHFLLFVVLCCWLS